MSERPHVTLVWPRLSDSPEQAEKMKGFVMEKAARAKDPTVRAALMMAADRLDQEWNPKVHPEELAHRATDEVRGY